MAQITEEYVRSFDPAYQQRRDGIQTQINAIPGQLNEALNTAQEQYRAQLGTLDTQRQDYARQADVSAGTRGMAWSNVADNYKSNYDKNNFTPAVTNLNNTLNANQRSLNENYNNRRMSLEDALNALTGEQWQFAQSSWQREQDRAEQARQAAAANALNQGYLDLQRQAATPQEQPRLQYAFDPETTTVRNVDSGRAVRVGTYVNDVTNKGGGNFNYNAIQTLNDMAAKGDRAAAYVLNTVKQNGGNLVYAGGEGATSTVTPRGTVNIGNLSELRNALNGLGLDIRW